MKHFKSKLLCILLLSGIFSYTTVYAKHKSLREKWKEHREHKKDEKEEKKEAKEAEEKTTDKETKSKVGTFAKKVTSALAKKAINFIVELTEKYQKTLKMSDLLNFVKVPPSPMRTYLDKFVIKSPVVGIVETGGSITGVNISGEMDIGDVKLKAFLEVGKQSGKDAYVIIYLQSPDKLRLSKIFPRAFSIEPFLNKLGIKGAKAKTLAKKFEVPDLFELDDAYLYVSSAEIAKHPKLDDVYKGGGFKGKVKFIGFLSILDKAFALKGQPVEAEGKLTYKVAGSSFAIKIPTEATIFPDNKKLIPGFSVKFGGVKAPITLTVSLLDDFVPAIAGSGGFVMQLPKELYKDPLVFVGKIKLAETQLMVEGMQKTPIKSVFGIKDFNFDPFKIGLIWDFEVSAELATLTAELGGIGALLPSGITFGGGVQAGDYKLKTDVKLAASGTKAIDVIYKLDGTADYKSFVKFWGNVFAKRIPGLKNAVDKLVKLTPDWKFEDVHVDAAWSQEAAEKKFEASIGKFQLFPKISGSGSLNISESELSFSGAVTPIVIKNPITGTTMFTATKSSKSKDAAHKGPHFAFKTTLVPPDLSGTLDAHLKLFMGPKLGTIEEDILINLSTSAIKFFVKQKFLNLYDSKIDVSAALNDAGDIDPKSFYIDVLTESGGIKAINNLLKTLGVKTLKDTKDKVVAAMTKELDDIKGEQARQVNKLKSKAASLKKQADDFMHQRDEASSKANEFLKTAGKSIWDVIKQCAGAPWKAKECAEKIISGAKNSATKFQRAAQAAYNQAKKFGSDAGNALASANRLAGLTIGQGTIAGARGTLKELLGPKVLDAYDALNKQLLKIGNIIAQIEKGTIVVRKMGFKGSLVDTTQGKSPSMEIGGDAFGKPFDIKTPSVDLSGPIGVIRVILNYLGVKV